MVFCIVIQEGALLSSAEPQLFPVISDNDTSDREEVVSKAEIRRRHIYTIRVSRDMRDQFLQLAVERGLSPSELAEAALALLTPTAAAAIADPGEPTAGEREFQAITLTNGSVRRVGRYPTLRLRLPKNLGTSYIRQALTLALALNRGDRYRLVSAGESRSIATRIETLERHNRELTAALDRVTFKPLPTKNLTLRQAASIFGFPNEWSCDEGKVKQRFRDLAPIFHPDTGLLSCRERMEQLIQAKNILLRHLGN